MSTGKIDPEMRRHFDEAEKIRIHETPLRRPSLCATADTLRAHFASDVARTATELENPHVEPRVTDEERARAVPASVLIAIVLREAGPTILFTQREHGISFPGHWVFPGGRSDPNDATPIATALRETEEEIGLGPERIELLGRLGDYVSHSGFRIAPAVALVHPPFDLTPHPREVAAIAEIDLTQILDSSSYFLFRFRNRLDRAHFAMDSTTEDLLLTGVTVSICIGLYAELSKTHSGGS
ncbi:MAG: coenzyme A pyrophosphatase [Deltaproteobacteria bacterium]|jgi:8-oxo-dGTP pyrophosphatase MutT (NUDIX family)|nr:coenzyme A pyrophosphatase [Deltaproteobacteria bacterium]